MKAVQAGQIELRPTRRGCFRRQGDSADQEWTDVQSGGAVPRLDRQNSFSTLCSGTLTRAP